MPRKNKGATLNWRSDRNLYEIIWYEQGRRKRCSTSTSDLATAQRKLAELLQQQYNATVPAIPDRPYPPHERMIGDVLAEYAKEKQTILEPIIYKNILGHIKRLAVYWAALPVSAIKQSTCVAYLNTRKAKVCAREELIFLRAAIRLDHKHGRLTEVPHVWVPPPASARERFLTRHEVAKLLWAARKSTNHENLCLFIRMALYTASRKRAILDLRWPKVDKENIDFRKAKQTNKRRGIKKIHVKIKTALKAARRRGTELGYVFHINGKPVKDIRTSFKTACMRAGLKDVSPHTLKHTSISWMVQKGTALFDVSQYADHTTTKMIEKTYGHLRPEHQKRPHEGLMK